MPLYLHAYLFQSILIIIIYIYFYNIPGHLWRKITKCDWLWVRSPPEEMKYLFSFLRSGVEAKRGVKFRHLTRNAPINSVECREQSD